MESKVYWAELQSALSGVGLSVVVDIPKRGYPWFGKIDNKPFTMTIPPKSEEDGLRDFMVISLYGQEEKGAIPLLSRFMGYEPFCKYLHKKNAEASITYEWDRKDPKARLKELEEDADVYEVRRMEGGFQSPQTQDMKRFFQRLTPEIVEYWKKAVQNNPDVEWNSNRIRSLLPFLKKVMPRIGRNQSLFGLSIISLDGKTQNEREIVQYGLEPLLTTRILTQEEAERVISWYLQTQPTWDSGGVGHFQKEFEVEGVRYKLITNSYRNCRDLNLQVLT
jgi:hypothetical protein